MTRMEVSVTIDRPVDEVWKFTTDWSNNWDPASSGTRQTSAGPSGVGTTLRLTRPSYPRIMDVRITEYEPNRKFTMSFTSGPLTGTKVTYGMEAVEGKTKFTETADYNLPGLFKLLGPFVTRAGKLRKEGEARIGNAKRLLESGAKTMPA